MTAKVSDQKMSAHVSINSTPAGAPPSGTILYTRLEGMRGSDDGNESLRRCRAKHHSIENWRKNVGEHTKCDRQQSTNKTGLEDPQRN
jgi:hypothetical protein